MEEEFVKEHRIKELTAKDKDEDIIKNVIKANQAKLDYLLKKAKRRGILLSMIEEIEMKTKKAM